jgi:hypothetical protein
MDNNSKYAKGFNDGYILGKYENLLFEMLTATLKNPEDSYFTGIFDGKAQFEYEKVNEKIKEFKNIKKRNQDLGTDKSPEI